MTAFASTKPVVTASTQSSFGPDESLRSSDELGQPTTHPGEGERSISPRTDPARESLEIGEVYRLQRQDLGGYLHSVDYDEGRFIHVRILAGPNERGVYDCTTRGDDGKHLGPGGGWSLEYEQQSGMRFTANQLEPIPEAGS